MADLKDTTNGNVFVPEVYSVGPQAVLFPQAGAPLLSPIKAAMVSLAGFLASLDFCRWGGAAPNTNFKLNDVFTEWQEADKTLPYPCASIIDGEPVEYGASSLVPHVLEETHNLYGKNTVLWKTDEIDVDFQVDFFATDVPTRDALDARLPSAFAPGEDGSRVVLVGSTLYYNRPVRAYLKDSWRMDNPDSVHARERRLRSMITCTIDVVDLRCVSLLQASTRYTIGEQVVPAPETPAPPLPVEEP